MSVVIHSLYSGFKRLLFFALLEEKREEKKERKKKEEKSIFCLRVFMKESCMIERNEFLVHRLCIDYCGTAGSIASIGGKRCFDRREALLRSASHWSSGNKQGGFGLDRRPRRCHRLWVGGQREIADSGELSPPVAVRSCVRVLTSKPFIGPTISRWLV